jgi:2-C-methyl-D-erythritol 2,4-cyclodiphosphate synthase
VKNSIRVGNGFDIHPFADGRKLFLGGVEIPHTRGLEGHSDADVVLHAVCDALLGALALGDIGKHFPNTDPAYKNIDSKLLLSHVMTLINEKGYEPGNLDIMILAERPKILSHIRAMQQTIAGIMQTTVDYISIKTTTMEKLGSIGREEGIAAFATVLLFKIDK